MLIHNVLASLAVTDIVKARGWYQRVLQKQPANQPMHTVVEWFFSAGGGLQLFEQPARAGGCSATFIVSNIESVRTSLVDAGITSIEELDSKEFRVLMVQDPDGNHLAFSQSIAVISV